MNSIYGYGISRGYIIYNDTNDSLHPSNDNDTNEWDDFRKSESAWGMAIYEHFIHSQNTYNTTIKKGGELLKIVAQNERNKEERYFHELYPNVVLPTEQTAYIKVINEVYTGEDRFRNILKRINTNIEMNLEREAAGKKTGVLAPSMMMTYVDYFTGSLQEWLEKNLNDLKKINLFIEKNEEFWDEGITWAMDLTFEKIAFSSDSKNTALLGSGHDYEDLVDLMHKNEFFRELLKKELHLDRVEEGVKNFILQQQAKIKGTKKKLPKLKYSRKNLESKNYMGVSSRAKKSRLGGLLDEVTETELAAAMISSTGHKAGGGVIGKRINATDATLFVSSIRTNLEPMIAEYFQAVEGKNQKQIAQQLKKFYQHWRGQTQKTFFTVSTSNKLYSLKSDTTFHKEARLSNLFEVLKYTFTSTHGGHTKTEDGYGWFTNTHDIRILTGLLYNTIDGAFLSEPTIRDNLIEKLTQILATAAASLIFSDYYEVGHEENKSVNAIHLFDLDNVYIPLSVILQGMSEAYLKSMDYQDYIQINGFTPMTSETLKILYPKANNESDTQRYKDVYQITEEERKKGVRQAKGTNFISEAFNEQRRAAQMDTKFEIHFVNNFKQTIQEILKSYQ